MKWKWSSRITNGILVAVEESGNIVLASDDARCVTLTTVTNVADLIFALNMALVMQAVHEEAS